VEDYFGIIVFIIIVLFSLLGRKKPQQPPGPPPRQRLPQQPSEQREAPEPLPEYSRPHGTTRAQQQETESAQDMVPADLWELLTGERRLPEPTREEEPVSPWEPPPEPEYRREPEPEPVYWEPPEEREVPVRLPEPPLERVPPERPPRVVVSLEESDPERRRARETRRRDAARRRARERVSDLRPVQASTVERSPFTDLLTGRDDLQRAIVLREVLGPPKGLE
jgi:hypothetical protein